jgi:hypothetical protein
MSVPWSEPFEMGLPASKRHNALKHAGFSAATILPGESAAEFEKLLQALIAEFRPNGALEEETVDSLAHLLWRKKNFVTYRLAERARQRVAEIQEAVISGPSLNPPGSDGASDFDATFAQKERAAETEARKELKDLYRLVEIGEEATIACLMKDLAIHERLDAMIEKCLKRLLLIRGGEIFVASVARSCSRTSLQALTSFLIGANAKRSAAVQVSARAPGCSQWL